jgi:bacterioferritin-associated ferredoxin
VYVCVCNAYRESHVRDAIKKSADNKVTVEQVYARLGSGPRCGRCLTHVKRMIDSNREKPATANAAC